MNIGIKDVLNQIRPFFILYLVILVICLVAKLFFSRPDIYFTVNSHNSDWADYLAPYLTDLGDGWTVIILSIILLLFNYRAAFLMGTSYAITSIAAQLIKRFVDAPRPALYFQSALGRIHFVKGVEMFKVQSFPSGHTVTAFSVAVVATYLIKNKNWGILLLIEAMLVGYSRMYLSEHFFEDVTAGSILGVIITVIWLTFIENKKFIHTPKWDRGIIKSVVKSPKS